MSKPKMLLSGYFGFDNLGDEAILDYMVHFMKSNNIEPIVLSSNPKRTETLYNAASIDRMDFAAIREVLKDSDGLISGGGSLLQDTTSKKSLLYYLFIMNLAKQNDKPFYFYGQGIGPIASRVMKWTTKSVLKDASAISVRDEDSKLFLENQVRLNNPIEVINDPVLFYPIAKENANYLLSNEEMDFLKKEPVFLSIRPSVNDKMILEEIEKYIQKANDEGIPIISFGLHPEQDSEFTKAIMDKYDNCLFIDRTIDLKTASYILKKSSMVVGMRLHSLILAASQCTPFAGISYDPKIDSFLNKYGKESIGSTSALDSKALMDETKKILGNKDSIQQELRSKKDQMQEVNDAYNRSLINQLEVKGV